MRFLLFLMLFFASFSSLAVPCTSVDVRVQGHGEVAHLAPVMQKEAVALYEKARAYVGATSCAPITVHLVKDTPEAKRLLPAWHLPPWAAGAAKPEERTAFVTVLTDGRPTDQKRVMLHELAHIALADAAGGKRLPRWFDEGASRRIAGEDGQDDDRVLAVAKIQKRMMTLEGLTFSFPGNADAASLAYAVSGRAIELLESEEGYGSVAKVLTLFAGGQDFDDAFESVAHKPIWKMSGEVERSVTPVFAWMTILREGEILMPATGFAFLFLGVFARRRQRARKEAMDDHVPVPLLTQSFGIATKRWTTGTKPFAPRTSFIH